MSIEIVDEAALLKDQLPQPSRHVRIYVDTEKFVQDDKIQIFLQQEPEAISPRRDFLQKHHNQYHTILTFDKEIIKTCPNAIFFIFYTPTWLLKEYYYSINVTKKIFQISMLVGGKQLTPAHFLRLQLYFLQEDLQQHLPLVCFRSCAPPLLPEITLNPFLENKNMESKYVLFDTFQFHIAIENSRQANYFTEKLIDCLISKSIPIYYGCPNIHEFFDTSGWILLEDGTPDELLKKTGSLSPTYYSQFTEVIEKNYKKCFDYIHLYERLGKVLESIPGYI